MDGLLWQPVRFWGPASPNPILEGVSVPHAAAPRRPHAVFVLVALVLSLALGLGAQNVDADDSAKLQAREIGRAHV